MINYEKFIETNPNYSKHFIGEGFYAKCYKISSTDAYKCFKEPIDKKNCIFDDLRQFEGMNFEHIIFPKELTVDKISNPSLIYGYIKSYIAASALGNISLERILQMIRVLELEIDKLSNEYSIVAGDMHVDNFIVNNNGIYVIDTDLFYSDERCKTVHKSNMEAFNYEVFEKITRHSLYENSIYRDKHMINLFDSTIEGEVYLSKFLEAFIEYVSEREQKELSTVGELRRVLK